MLITVNFSKLLVISQEINADFCLFVWSFYYFVRFFFSNACTNPFINQGTFIDQAHKLQSEAVSSVSWLLYVPVYPITLGHKYVKWMLLMIQEERQTVEIYALVLSLVLYSHLLYYEIHYYIMSGVVYIYF